MAGVCRAGAWVPSCRELAEIAVSGGRLPRWGRGDGTNDRRRFGLVLCGCTVLEGPDGRQLRTEWLGDGAGIATVQVSPDGRSLLFDRVAGGDVDIYLMEIESRRTQRLLEGPANDRLPTWSPSGDSIAFVSDREGSEGIWIASSDGSGSRRVGSLDARATSPPVWSPDGTKLAFSTLDRTRPGNVSYGRGVVLMLDLASGGAEELTAEGDEWWASWARDGSEIFYYVGNSDEIGAVDVTTRTVRVVQGGRYVGWRPAASPVGDEIAVISDMIGSGLFLVRTVPERRYRWSSTEIRICLHGYRMDRDWSSRSIPPALSS